MVAKKKTAKKATARKTSKKRAGGRSQLEAAAEVLAEAGRAMSCADMVEAMAEKRYWKSPAGKTPASTLYSTLLRQIQRHAKEARGSGRSSAASSSCGSKPKRPIDDPTRRPQGRGVWSCGQEAQNRPGLS